MVDICLPLCYNVYIKLTNRKNIMNPIITKMKPLRVNTMRDEQQIAIKALDSIGAVVYASEVAGSFYARGYLRNGRNPKFNYRFSTDARRTEYVTTWASDLEAREASKLAARAAKKTSKHSLVVGDILNTSWCCSLCKRSGW